MLRTTWTTHALVAAVGFLFLGPAVPPLLAQNTRWVWVERYQFDIDPNTPLKELLPIPPKAVPINKVLGDDLAQVPEVQFQEPSVPRVNDKREKAAGAELSALAATAHQIARINFLNRHRTDHFMERLLEQRPDLAGLPFLLGQDCRRAGEERAQLRKEIPRVRSLLAAVQAYDPEHLKESPLAEQKRLQLQAEIFWGVYDHNLRSDAGRKRPPHQEGCATAALMQILGPGSPQLHAGLVRQLASFDTTAAGKEQSARALAQLAVFAQEGETRQAATAALHKRDAAAVTPVLLRGLRYPWPAVARNAAAAIARLKRTDLVPELVKLLGEPDPRAPMVQTISGAQVAVVRELVRVNHHRNCLLCHAPADTTEIYGKIREVKKSSAEVTVKGVRVQQVGLESLNVSADTGPVLIPGSPFPERSAYYSQPSSPDIFVRADVTYLRQDFSVMQRVPDAAPWPELQRFDFLVRTRVVTEQEAIVYRAEFVGQVNPYHEAALDALRELTGRDAGTTAQEWRAALRLP
jgi:hypothetical protein